MTELQILDAETSVALEDIVAASGLAREEVIELVEHGQGSKNAGRRYSHISTVHRPSPVFGCC